MLEAALQRNPKLKTIYDRVKDIPPVDAGHDFSHTVRVAKLAAKIVSEEAFRQERIQASDAMIDGAIASALMHDCVPVPKNSPLRKESARLCSEKAQEWLWELQWEPVEQIQEITGADLDHSYSGGRVPTTLLGQALQDADRLEALGALGLYRTIATGVSMGTTLFDVMDPWAEHRSLDDKRFTIDHFFTKLLKLPETFRTKAAQEEAKSRANYLQGFLDQLRHEIQIN